jgi:hypothetical protein
MQQQLIICENAFDFRKEVNTAFKNGWTIIPETLKFCQTEQSLKVIFMCVVEAS